MSNGPGARRAPPPWQRRANAQPRRQFLDQRREEHFRYDIRQALDEARMPEEQRNAFYASMYSKGTRNGTQEAKEFAQQKVDEGLITPQLRDRLQMLVERYSTWR